MIIVTGGAGFIGSCLVKRLNDEGITDIIIVDNLGKSEKWKNLRGKTFYSYFDKNEFLEELTFLDEDIELIVHLGACSETTETDASYLMKNNFQYTHQLANFALDNDIRFIYASSASTYGSGEFGYNESNIQKLKPMNCYAFTKQAFDLWAEDNSLFNEITGLKFFNVFGPNEYHKGKMLSMVYQAHKQINETGKVKLFKSYHPDFKDGEQKRDFIYVKDVVDIIYNIIESDISGLYNVGTGIASSWNDLANATFKAMNKRNNIEYVDMPEQLKNQYQYFTQADMAKLQSEIKLNFRTLEESVNDYVCNYLMSDDIYL